LATLLVLAWGEISLPAAARPLTRGALALRTYHLLGRVKNCAKSAREGVSGAGASVDGRSEGFGIVLDVKDA
jgi:hypothetical protein